MVRVALVSRHQEAFHVDDHDDDDPGITPHLRRCTASASMSTSGSSRRGQLTDPGRVELVNGYMVDKTAKTTQHGYSTRKVLDGTVGGRLRVGYWRVATLLNLVMSPDLLVAG